MNDKVVEEALKEIFNYLTEDIENVKSKPWLKKAISSHMKKLLKLRSITISDDKLWSFINHSFTPQLYKGDFNIYGETRTIYVRSASNDCSIIKSLMLNKLSKDCGMSANMLHTVFNGSMDNYYISIADETQRYDAKDKTDYTAIIERKVNEIND